MTAGVISRIISITPALERGWKPDFRAADLLPWISGNLWCLSLSHSDIWGCRGWAPGVDGCPWLWHHGFRCSGSGTRCPLIQMSEMHQKAALGSGRAGLQAGTASPLWKKPGPRGGMDSHPSIRQSSLSRWFWVMCPLHSQDGWKRWYTQVLLKPVQIPLCSSAVHCCGLCW